MQSKLIQVAPRSLHRGLAALTLTAVMAANVPARAQEATPAVHLDVTRAAIALLPPRAPLATAAAETTPAPAPAPAPSADEGAGLRMAGYVAGGVGIAGLFLFAIAGLGAKNAYDDLDAACGSSPCTDDAQQSKIDEGRLLQTAANLGLAAGLSGIGVGATLLVLGNKSSLDKHDNSSSSASANGAMITYGGQF